MSRRRHIRTISSNEANNSNNEEEEIIDNTPEEHEIQPSEMEELKALIRKAFDTGFFTAQQDFNGEVCSQLRAPASIQDIRINDKWANSEAVKRLREEAVEALVQKFAGE